MDGIRKSVRYESDKNRPVKVSFTDDRPVEEEDLIGLVVNLSFNGSCLVFTGTTYLAQDQTVAIKIENFPSVLARVAWVKELAEKVYMCGFEHIKDIL
ncbi:MAG: hypothetical protein H6622_03980 [Halobacteriovoraceae bacterium]|nr:hypothetical protein [Halobacteriovoraceae bacterium]